MIPLYLFETVKELKDYQEQISQLYIKKNKLIKEADIYFSNSMFEDTVCLSQDNLVEVINQFKEQGFLLGIEGETDHFTNKLLNKIEDFDCQVKKINKKIEDINKIQKVTRLEFQRLIFEILPEIKTTSNFYNNQFNINLFGSQKDSILKYLEDNKIIFRITQRFNDTIIIIENISMRDFNINGVNIDLDIINVIEKVFKIDITKNSTYKSVISPLDLTELRYLIERRKIYFDIINKGEKPPFIVPYIKEI